MVKYRAALWSFLKLTALVFYHVFSPLKESKSLRLFWSYQLASSANPAYIPRKWVKWAKLAVLFRW